jgi:hypothetical protein
VSAVRAEPIEPGGDPVDRFAERVQEHFRAAVKRGYRTPDIESCRELARYLEAIRDWPQFRPDAEIDAEIKRDRKVVLPPDPEVSAVITLGDGFLSALLALAPKLDAILADWEDPRAVETLRRSCDEVLTHMIQVMVLLKANLAPAKHWHKALPTSVLVALLPRFTGERVPDTIQIVAALARQAWEKANGVQEYPSNEKTAPLCKFVTAALSEIGIYAAPATVASILQGRRHRNNLADRIDTIYRALQR